MKKRKITKSIDLKNHGITMNGILIIIVVILLLLLAGLLSYFVITKINKKPVPVRVINKNESLISITKDGFSPILTTVARKKIMIFRNNDTVLHRITSKYPRFSTTSIAPGSEYTYVFLIPGKWEVQLIENPSSKVTITVTPQ